MTAASANRPGAVELAGTAEQLVAFFRGEDTAGITLAGADKPVRRLRELLGRRRAAADA